MLMRCVDTTGRDTLTYLNALWVHSWGVKNNRRQRKGGEITVGLLHVCMYCDYGELKNGVETGLEAEIS